MSNKAFAHLLLWLLLAWNSVGSAFSDTLPSFRQVEAAHRPSEAWLVDRNGAPLDTLNLDPKVRRLPWVPLRELSPAMRHALIVSEDKRFYQHSGVDWRAFIGAAWENLVYDTHRGASTLTMQLAGLLDPALYRRAGGRTYTQKWDQIKAARSMEKTWSKAQILDAYLNKVNFRANLSGINAAAQGLFGQEPSRLNKAQASILAALLRGPNAKAAVVAERACGVAQQLTVPRPSCATVTALAYKSLVARPHIDFGEQLAPAVARMFLHTPGERVQVSLDAGLQRFALQALQSRLAALKANNVDAGAVVVLNNKTGEVRAYVGSSAGASSPQRVDEAATAQPAGATLQPFLYGLAIEQRLLSAASFLDDSAALQTSSTQGMWQDDNRELGNWVTLRTALGSSLHVPAVRTLALVTPAAFYERLQALGLATPSDRPPQRYGYAPGETAVTLTGLTNAYRVLANGGVLKPLSFHVGGAPGATQIMPAPVAAIVTDILADNNARAMKAGLHSALTTSGFAAVKTGTSPDMRNNWCVGFSDKYTVGVWVGNISGEPMRDVSDVNGAAPVWQALISKLNTARPSRAPALPSGVIAQTVRFEPPLEPPRRELFLPGTEQSVVTLAEGKGLPRIIGPANGTMLTLDADIPAAWQKMRFYSRPLHMQWNWLVDGEPAPAQWLQTDGSLLYTPQPGAHRISLVDEQGRALDTASFMVQVQTTP
ncbi:penicillin-binding protein 1C [Sulfuriferula plumbiphila]|uniref:peptidoglycan glycosyltransferase n=1 Tax=Sulfuriferula plumbiphila TaxID=171865 RepID=A0A512LC44_9PROT|nr:transglycosylase domain-containing protein [Sulfuriferula plumbiphila]BBP04107.1 penicillin-binding protein 1C [Sulfuriferula plumbiphila]GEP32045.1 penicillin-binding protein 1C [Sulfuriferula plumbiphila]